MSEAADGRHVAGDIVEIGNRLIAVKAALDHGAWLSWLDEEFGWSRQSADRFIAVAEAFGTKLLSGNLSASPVRRLWRADQLWTEP